MKKTQKQLNTTLAGLRYLQQNYLIAAPFFEAQGFGKLLTQLEIDEFCEQLNSSLTQVTAEVILERYKAGDRNFNELQLAEINLRSALFSNVNLRGTKLIRADLKYIDLRDSDLTNANLCHANLTHSNLTNTTLADGYLKGILLWGANLTGANLMNANLMNANLQDANLTNANLTQANLSGAKLAKANFTGVKPPFENHEFWGELLAQKATNQEQKALACMVSGGNRFAWCWSDFLNWNHPLEDWALKTIASYNLNLDDCPYKADILKRALAGK